MLKNKKRKKPEALAMRIVKGGMVPADAFSQSRLRARGYHIDDIVFIQVKKPRNPGYHKMVFRLCTLCVKNIDDFANSDAYHVLKRLQMEGDIYCEYFAYNMPGYGMITTKTPESISFENMDQGEFEEVYKGLCRIIAQNYWHDLTEDEIAEMAEIMDDE